MFNPKICWLKSRMVLWDLFNFKMYLFILKVNVFLQENKQIQYIMYILFNIYSLSLFVPQFGPNT